MVSLDNFDDNLCLWRCIAVQKRKAHRLGIRVPNPERRENGEFLWHLRKNPSDKLKNIKMIGIYKGHEFLIKDMNKLANLYVCVNCQARFTKGYILQRHAKLCSQRRKIIGCSNERVEALKTAHERAFYNKSTYSSSSIRWLGCTSNLWGKHIDHALCGNGGERWRVGASVDGYDPISKTVFQYNGCHWHGCVKCFPIVSSLRKGPKSVATGVGNGLRALGKKAAQILPGLIGTIASFIFKTAGLVISFLG